MADAKAKTINLLLYEGDLEGVISIEDSSWNSGELYSAPRDRYFRPGTKVDITFGIDRVKLRLQLRYCVRNC